jgi:chemotaxis response regulator CheB
MQNMFTRLLAERLNTQTALKVVEAADGRVLQAGTVYWRIAGRAALKRQADGRRAS